MLKVLFNSDKFELSEVSIFNQKNLSINNIGKDKRINR